MRRFARYKSLDVGFEKEFLCNSVAGSKVSKKKKRSKIGGFLE